MSQVSPMFLVSSGSSIPGDSSVPSVPGEPGVSSVPGDSIVLTLFPGLPRLYMVASDTFEAVTKSLG